MVSKFLLYLLLTGKLSFFFYEMTTKIDRGDTLDFKQSNLVRLAS